MKTFYHLMEVSTADLVRVQRIRSLRFELMACQSEKAVRRLIDANTAFLNDNPEVLEMFARRLNAIEKMRHLKLEAHKERLN